MKIVKITNYDGTTALWEYDQIILQSEEQSGEKRNITIQLKGLKTYKTKSKIRQVLISLLIG